jgi:hypothetical protein
MRIAITFLSLLMLAACQTTAQHTCLREGYKEGTPEFRECVATQREEESMRMEKKAGEGGL